jgi:hypothetical protein
MIKNVPRRLLVCVLAGLLLGLAAAAYADPPDPTWIRGYWDDDDYDWVTVWTAVARVEPVVLGALVAPVHSAARPRAPPVRVSPSR